MRAALALSTCVYLTKFQILLKLLTVQVNSLRLPNQRKFRIHHYSTTSKHKTKLNLYFGENLALILNLFSQDRQKKLQQKPQ